MSNILTSVERQPFEWIEIDQPLCVNDYGSTPCLAILGTTGANKCFNTRASCQDPANYDQTDSVLTLRFAHNQARLPDDNYYFPYLQRATITPAKINPGGASRNTSALGMRSTLSVTLSDHPHTDRIVDPYLDERNYIATDKSTFWAKWKARNPYYMHRVIRHKSGFIDPATGLPDLSTLITRTFFITGFAGPTSDGMVSIKAKDILTLAADEKAKAPAVNTGRLNADITAAATTFTASPSGIGDLEYSNSGLIRIGKEVMGFTRASDVFTITRAQRNTDAKDHKLNDTVQECLEYTSKLPREILEDLLVNYANVPTTYLDLAQWAQEATDYLPRLYSSLITEPTGVSSLINELTEQMYFTTFWNDREGLLKMRALRPAEDESITALNDESNLLEDSIQWTDNPGELITQVWVYYAQIDPTEKLNDGSNYGAIEVIIDPDAESTDKNGIKKIKTIFARWLTGADGAAAQELGDRLLARYRNIPRQCTFKLDAKDSALWLADFLTITNRNVVDFIGEVTPVSMQVISAQESQQGTTFSYSAIEYSAPPEDSAPAELTIAISTDLVNVNLRTLFDSLYAVTPISGDKIRFTIRDGVNIGSASFIAGENVDPNDIDLTDYTLNGQYMLINDSGVEVAENLTLPKFSRHVIASEKTYAYSLGSGDVYIDPDTGVSTGYEVTADVIETPTKSALKTGTWPAGVELFLDIEASGRIMGEGGVGGTTKLVDRGEGLYSVPDFIRGGDGGHALDITHAITINNLGIIAGGGGGGEVNIYHPPDNYIEGGANDSGNTLGNFSTIVIPGSGGAGFENFFQLQSFVYRDVTDFSGISYMPTNGITYTEPAASVTESPGLGGALDWRGALTIASFGGGYYPRSFTSGDGGELAQDGGEGSGLVGAFIFPPGTSPDVSWGLEKQGKAGYAIKDGQELVTWVQKGDVRGSEF